MYHTLASNLKHSHSHFEFILNGGRKNNRIKSKRAALAFLQFCNPIPPTSKCKKEIESRFSRMTAVTVLPKE